MDPSDTKPADTRLDIVDTPPPGATGRPWLQVIFTCANAYQKVFRSVDGRMYHARCPKCAKSITFSVGPGGTDQRVFHVSC